MGTRQRRENEPSVGAGLLTHLMLDAFDHLSHSDGSLVRVRDVGCFDMIAHLLGVEAVAVFGLRSAWVGGDQAAGADASFDYDDVADEQAFLEDVARVVSSVDGYAFFDIDRRPAGRPDGGDDLLRFVFPMIGCLVW